MTTDFIVIGSGLAGLTSSLVLSEFGKVLLITKGNLSDGSTNWAQGGIACVSEKGDNWKKHLKDTLNAGVYHNDREAVEYLVKNAPAAIDWLLQQGVPFEKIKGKFKTGREGGHSYNRIIHATDFTGKEIELALSQRIKENRNIKILENCFVMNLLVKDKICYGVRILSSRVPLVAGRGDPLILQEDGYKHHSGSGGIASFPDLHRGPRNDIIDCFSRVVILATGGLGQIYAWTTNPLVSTGDGYVLTYQAGAIMKDMEFIQFHPTALKYGESPLFLLSEALRGEGAWLVRIQSSEFRVQNKNGERFMYKYDKRGELAPRDIVARAIFEEQQNGYEVYLNIRHKGKKFLTERFPNIFKELKRRGFDLSHDLIPVTPAAHFSCGGVETDLYGRTNIKNLFAFGEVACTGVHGANRLASNSLLEAVVFPLRLKEIFPNIIPDLGPEDPFPARLNLVSEDMKAFKLGTTSLINLRSKLQHLMWEKVGIVRRRKDLLKAKEQLELWEKNLASLDYPSRELWELKNMILVARLITEAAIKRKKSLGAHLVLSIEQ